MASSSKNSDLYRHQMNACQNFFHEKLPDFPQLKPLEEHEIPEFMLRLKYKKPIYLYDITGLNAQKVVAALVGIVNDREKFTINKNFYLTMKHDVKEEKLFRLTARPTTHQPGNGIMVMRPRGREKFARSSGKTYEQLTEALREHYQDTITFTKDIRKIFLNNEVSDCDFPRVTLEAYMILLFEIARRLVKVNGPSEIKKQYDDLPIGSAITGIVKLLEYSKDEVCTFENTFLPKDRFHFFSGKPQTRKRAIDDINIALVNAESEKTATTSYVSKKRKVVPGTEKIITSKSLKKCSAHEKKCLSKNLRKKVPVEKNSVYLECIS